MANTTTSKCSILISALLCSASLLSFLILTSSVSLADDEVVANVAVSVPVSCMMSGTEDTAHSASINAGTYVDDIGLTTLKVVCNENSGFSIYAIGYSNEEFGNNKLLATVGGELSPTYDIVTGTAKSGATSNWAMKLNAVSGTYTPSIENNYDDYNNVPTTYTKVATFNSSTDATIGASVQATYAAYVASDQPAGTYNGKVKYTMVHPASEVPAQPQTTASGKICYYANVSDAVGTMGCQDVSSSVTLLASNFSRNGYGFAGWSDAFDYKTNSNANFYGPNETLTIPDTSIYTGEGKGLSLYAVWVKSAGNLQSWSGCSSLTSANEATNILTQSITALSDQRDNNTYAIAKLADGNCWMIENLRLESTNSDNSAGALAQGYGGQFAGLADAEPAWTNNLTTANSLYYSGTQDGTATIDIGTSNPGYRFPRYNHDNTNSRASSPTGNGVAMYSYGNYYTWPAAIADTTAYTTNNQSAENYSICPAGWHLPKGGNKSNEANNEFWSLVVTGINNGTNPANYESSTQPYYTGNPEGTNASSALRAYPNNFVYSDYVYSGSVSNRGSYGGYWSSTAYSSSSAYNLGLDSSYVSPGTVSSNKYGGRTVRCVASGA